MTVLSDEIWITRYMILKQSLFSFMLEGSRPRSIYDNVPQDTDQLSETEATEESLDEVDGLNEKEEDEILDEIERRMVENVHEEEVL